MNYIDYLKRGGATSESIPKSDTIEVTSYFVKDPGDLINTDFFSRNNLKYVKGKLVKASDALDTKMDAFRNFLNSYANSLDVAFGIKRNTNSLYLDSNWDVNRLVYNL